MMLNRFIVIGFAMGLMCGPLSAKPRIIFDTDMDSDFDDAGALAVLHALADKGECEILAVMHSTSTAWSVGVIDAINTYYHRGDLPIGARKRTDNDNRSSYAEKIAKDTSRFKHNVTDWNHKDVTQAKVLYKSILSKQNDQSTTIVTVGPYLNLLDLLNDPEAVALIRKKVKLLSIMGGHFNPPGHTEWNISQKGRYEDGPKAGKAVIERWPTPVMWSDVHIGVRLPTGKRLQYTAQDNPVREAYRLALHNKWRDHASWDQTAVLFAVRGLRDYWLACTTGRPVMYQDQDGNWATDWPASPDSNHAYLRLKKGSAELAKIIEDLMIAPPVMPTPLSVKDGPHKSKCGGPRDAGRSVKTSADSVAFPGTDWEETAPEAQGVDSAKLESAVEFLKNNTPHDGVKRLVIVRNGQIIWKGDQADRRQRVWSVTKAFTSTAHGLLIDDGKCTLDTLAKDYNPKLAQHYPTVTLRHLATMTSGIDSVGGSYDCDAEGRCDRNALADPLPPFFPPGTKYQYWDEATQQYGFVLTKIAGEPLHDLLQRRILGPIGIQEVGWQPDETRKVPNWTGGLEISASDLARFGHLFLNRGRWNGNQLISAEWVDAATSVQVPPSIPDALPTSNRKGSGVYGYHWWPNGTRPDGTRRWQHAPQGTYGRSGHNNNDLFVLPAWNMVIVRLGLDERKSSGGFPITNATYSEFFKRVSEAILDPIVEGDRRVWHPLTVNLRGPAASETDDDPNPFLDYGLQVTFSGPSGQKYDVAGFFDGDGHGDGSGNVWRVRFTPDQSGTWHYKTSFRQGDKVAISLDPNDGKPIALDGKAGSFEVAPRDPKAPGHLKWGRLEYVGRHYLKFKDGPYWIRGGTDSPENLLAYDGFDNTPPSHRYAAHAEDWRPGDPDWDAGKGRAIVGTLNYLAAKRVNSVYFLTMNIGGDGGDVWPWAGSPNPKGSARNDNLHFDISKLKQWETVLAHAQRKGIFLHFVLNEAEKPNKQELDNGELGTERKLYYRELIARFGHHLALEWNLCEEYNIGFDLGHDRVRQFADYLKAIDPYDHPIAVHSARDPLKALQFTFGDERFSLTSIQLGQRKIDSLTEQFREATAKAGRPLPISMDEFTLDKGQEKGHIPVDDAERWRKEKLWPTYLSGGNIEFILGDLLKTDSFKTPERDRLWDYVWYARRFMEENLPFWEMEPADELLAGAATITATQNRGRQRYEIGAQVFARPGAVYAVYLPDTTTTGRIDLSDVTGTVELRWFNPRRGRFEGDAVSVRGGKKVSLGSPPTDVGQDWTVLIK
jgi:CubicO group peptidase (beta-lactamase class C family)/inosine-uridine nucleoside N-ribohydrolase